MGALTCGRVETYADDLLRVREIAPEVAAEISSFTGVGQVADWLSQRAHGPPRIDMIAMDEFEYDFLVEVEPNGRWLAFGVT